MVSAPRPGRKVEIAQEMASSGGGGGGLAAGGGTPQGGMAPQGSPKVSPRPAGLLPTSNNTAGGPAADPPRSAGSGVPQPPDRAARQPNV